MKHTHKTRSSSVMPVLAFAAIVSVAASFSVSAVVQGQIVRGSGKVIEDRGPQGISKTILTCEEAGLCANERRMLFPASNVRGIARLEARGCVVRHRLQSKVVLSCPKGMAPVSGAEPERVFRSQDLVSIEQINIAAAQSVGITGEGVRVAVLDTGIDATHPEISSHITLSKNFTAGGTTDALGHGTHVAGIVSGAGVKSIDGTRATGVATGAQLLIGKVCSDEGWCLEGDILAGIEWAVTENARVINMSLGGGAFGSDCDFDTLAQKANWAVERGVVVVAAAGNNGSGVGTPACGSKVISVGAVDSSNNRTSWSSWGTALDVMAPGVGILSAYSCTAAGSCPGPWYARMSGTSMAAPHVAGAAALLLQKYPHLSPAQVYESLTLGAKDLGVTGKDEYNGFGLIDIGGSLRAAGKYIIDNDGDGYGVDVDCNDEDTAINPGALEICNLIDDNCDGLVDEGFDADGDGVSACGGDCNDNDALIAPGAPELCNGIDDDCNGQLDDSCRFEGFCGDQICGDSESAFTCPLDCVLKSRKTESGRMFFSPKAICGNDICESGENLRRCAADCKGNTQIRSSGQSGSDSGSTSVSGGSGNANGGGNGNGNANGGGNGNGKSGN